MSRWDGRSAWLTVSPQITHGAATPCWQARDLSALSGAPDAATDGDPATYVRFDGVSFTVFDSSNAPDLANGRITSLYESRDRVLWIGHETGHLSKIAAGRFESVKLNGNWPGGVIEAITSDENGHVWLLNDSGVLFSVLDGMTAKIPGGASALQKIRELKPDIVTLDIEMPRLNGLQALEQIIQLP